MTNLIIWVLAFQLGAPLGDWYYNKQQRRKT